MSLSFCCIEENHRSSFFAFACLCNVDVGCVHGGLAREGERESTGKKDKQTNEENRIKESKHILWYDERIQFQAKLIN